MSTDIARYLFLSVNIVSYRDVWYRGGDIGRYHIPSESLISRFIGVSDGKRYRKMSDDVWHPISHRTMSDDVFSLNSMKTYIESCLAMSNDVGPMSDDVFSLNFYNSPPPPLQIKASLWRLPQQFDSLWLLTNVCTVWSQWHLRWAEQTWHVDCILNWPCCSISNYSENYGHPIGLNAIDIIDIWCSKSSS
jgi:hypothetical protein